MRNARFRSQNNDIVGGNNRSPTLITCRCAFHGKAVRDTGVAKDRSKRRWSRDLRGDREWFERSKVSRARARDLRKAAAKRQANDLSEVASLSLRWPHVADRNDRPCLRAFEARVHRGISFLRRNKNARSRRESRSRRVGHGVRTLSNEPLLRVLVPRSFSFYDRFISQRDTTRWPANVLSWLIPDSRFKILSLSAASYENRRKFTPPRLP